MGHVTEAFNRYLDKTGASKKLGNIKKSFQSYHDMSTDEIEEEIRWYWKHEYERYGGNDRFEIYQAARDVVWDMMSSLKRAKAMRVDNEEFGIKDGKATLVTSENLYKDEAIKYLKNIRYNTVDRMGKNIAYEYFTNNGALINDLVEKIDTAEKKALEKIELKCNPMQEDTNMRERSTVKFDKNGKIKTKINPNTGKKEIDRQQPIFEQNTDTGVLTFTARSNPLKIHKALNGLFPKGKHYKYKIDYSGCKNEKIKKTVMQLTGTGQCWITYDETAKTYLLRDKNGIPIKSRALIWDGVTLLRDGIDTWNKKEEEEKRKENIGKINAKIESNITPENDPALKEMVRDIPDSLKNKLKARGNHEYRRFIIETERRLGEILKYGKKHNYEIHTTEPVTKLRGTSGLMEVHFINGKAESDVTVWKNDKVLGKGLYDLLDGNEDDYAKYLTARVNKLWFGKFEELTKKDDLVTVKANYDLQESEKLPAETAGTIIKGIAMLKQFIENHRESEGDSRADNDDRYLVTMVQELRNLEYTIKERQDNTRKEDMEAAIEKSIYKLHECWQSYWGYGKYSDPAKDPERGKIKKALYGPTKQDQIQAIRSMAEGKRIFGDVTESSFLADEISTNGDSVKTDKAVVDPETGEAILDEDGNPVMETTVQGGLEVNDSVINAKFQNINKLLYTDLVYNDNNEIASSLTQRKIIDQLYTASSDTSGEQIISVLISNDMLPEGWRNDSDVKEKAKNIAESLRQKKAAAESLSLNDIKANEKKEKTELELKHNKTEEDFQRLQALEYLEAHPDEANKIHEVSLKKMQDEIKYGEINNLVRSALASVFVDKGGGAKGKNADIYNDIVGYGLWDLSDENAKIAGEILVEIIITVVVAVCTAGVGGAIVAGALRGASMLARAARWAKLANNIQKAIRIMKLGTKGFKVANRAGRTTQVLGKGTALLIEGTTFNAASNMIHSVTKGTSLDSLNLNPIAKENLQTAAFLGTLSLGNKIGMKVLTKLHGTTKIQAFSQAGLKEVLKNHKGIWTESLVSEATAMFGAEQGMNFFFGHDVINSETGEIETSRSFQRPTTQEWTQMIGMILAFKAVKPGLWQKYEKKLNDGTLEICRSVKKNEVLIRDPKTGKVENVQNLIEGSANSGTKGKESKRGTKTKERNAGNDKVIDRATEQLHEKFDQEIMSENGITIDGITYKLERRPNEGLNQNGKGRLVYTETGPDGKVIKENTRSVASESPELPDTGNGNRIRRILEGLKKKYVEKNLNSTLESARDELNGEFTRDIESRSRDLEGKRNDRTSLEGKKKNLSDEIDGLKSRKTQLEQQLQNISKELTIQPDISSLKDIEAVFFPRAGKTVSIGGVKCKFIGIKGDKIIFSEGKGKTREFSSFKELKEAGIKFDIDINVKQEKDRTKKTYDKQKEIFEKLVEKEARTKNANEIIKEYEQLQRQKAQIEQDIHDGFFRENADRLVNKHIWIDGVEYQCTGKNTNNGKTTLDFKQTDGSNHFTISSFEQLKSRGQVNGFGDRYEVIDKETRAAGRDLSKYERENHELLWGENGLFKGGDRYVNQKRQTLQQVDQQLKDSRTNYDNAKLATSPKRVPNPEYERIQKEIEGIDAQLIEKGQDLAKTERDLGASDIEINRLEQEINNLTAERENLSRNEDEIGNRGSNGGNEGSEGNRIEAQEEIKTSDDVLNKLNEIKLEPESRGFENIKLDWVTKAQFETGVFIEGVHRRFKNLSLKPNMKLPKEILKKMRDKLIEMKNTWGKKLSEYHRKLIEKYNNYIERKLAEKGEEVEIKNEEINSIEREGQENRQQQEQYRSSQVEQESRQIENKNERSKRPERGINTERREMREVQRNSDVIAIGDLHGNYMALKGNMEYAGLARETNGHLEWTGGNKKVVFQGDILGDRGTNGLKIIKEIHQLREQARKQGGDIDIIVGNHDDFMIAYILGGKVSRFAMNGEASALDIAMNGSQGKGLTELLDFIGIKRTGEFDDFFNLSRKNNEILNAMRNSPEGRMILEEICNMKLVSQVDDVLYCHTNPTSRMLQYLTRGNIQVNINTLNQNYQGYLRKALLGEGNGNISLDEFNNISDIFLNTGNRDISGIENYVEQLRNSGINMISHGHSGGSNDRGYTNNQIEIGGVRVIDTDYHYGNRGNFTNQHSVSVVKKEGGVNYMGDNVVNANLDLREVKYSTENEYSSRQKTKQEVDEIIRDKKGQRFKQSYQAEHNPELFEYDLDDFIKWAEQHAENTVSIMETLKNSTNALELFVAPNKSRDSIIRKMKDEIIPEGNSLSDLKDFTRASLLFNRYEDFSAGIEALHRMVAEGKIKDFNVKNRIDGGTADMLINIVSNEGFVSELQFHTPESLIMKEEYLGNKSKERYINDPNLDGSMLNNFYLTPEIFDLSLKPFSPKDQDILLRINGLKERKHPLTFPQQNQVLYSHNIYDIVREIPQTIEVFAEKGGLGQGFNYMDVIDLKDRLNQISSNLTKKAMESYYLRINN